MGFNVTQLVNGNSKDNPLYIVDVGNGEANFIERYTEYGVRFNVTASSSTGERVKKFNGVLTVDGGTNATGLFSEPATSIDGVGRSSFDHLFTPKLVAETNAFGDVNNFVQRDPYFLKQEIINDGTSTWLYYWACLTKLDGYRTPIPFQDGNGGVQPFLIGQEEGVVDANGRLRSISDGSFPSHTRTRGAFRTSARKNDGDGTNTNSKYQLRDAPITTDLINIPLMIEYATKNLQSIFRGHVDSTYDANTVADGASVAGASTAIVNNTDGANFVVGQGVYVSTDGKLHELLSIEADIPVAGQTTLTFGGDAVAILTGANLDPRQFKTGMFKTAKYHSCYYNSEIANGKQPFMWRYLINPYGDMWEFEDGRKIVNNQDWICTDPTQYNDDASSGGEYASPFVKLNYTNSNTNGYVKELGFDARYPFAQFPIDTNGGSNTYYADYYYQTLGDRTARVGGGWSDASVAGPFCWSLHVSLAGAVGSIGARLSKRP